MEDVMVFQRKKGTKVLTWGNRKYASFMISILRVLEPRRYFPEEIIMRDHDEVEEMLFVSRGEVIPVLLTSVYSTWSATRSTMK